MANITVSIPKKLHEKMKKHTEVKWSEVVRKALVDYLNRLENLEGGTAPAQNLREKLDASGLDVSEVDLDKAIEVYEKGRMMEWKRLSSTQTNS
jgi:Arc/MetJ-type ribon-helix-helix transcriptional regulator